MPNAYQHVNDFFTLAELIVLRSALLAFVIVGIWKILKREIEEARAPTERKKEHPSTTSGEPAEIKT